MGYAAARELLAAHGVALPTEGTQRFPVVVKLTEPARKSDIGGVWLDVSDEDELDLVTADLTVDSFSAEEMITDVTAELLVGVRCEYPVGIALTIAAGGIWTELFDDSATLLLPASRADIDAAIRQLRCWPIIAGSRGQPAANLDAAIDAIMAIAGAVSGDVVEIEVNPLLLTPDRAVAGDVLARVRR